MNAMPVMPDIDPARFLKIAGQGVSVTTHADLWHWLRGDVQCWLPHDVMLAGWGNFRTAELQYDVISSLPGVRTHNCDPVRTARLLVYFRDCWVAAQQSPCQLDLSDLAEFLGEMLPGCALSQVMPGMRSAFVHGMGDGKHNSQRIFVTLSSQVSPMHGLGTMLKLMLPYIDTALRQIPSAQGSLSPQERDRVESLMLHLASLSERERQIMVWVAMGKTNPEIGSILCISEFTVKNHMKSIFAKLDVTNRAQAVAQLTRMNSYA